ncbi:MAG: flagellar basal body P-ring formation protein FlgA [Deltaproteobacteria bacterium]|nr:flagellar basal body P-ring formation protein FlgA [Deltaproteobacteria bacterium]MBW2338787.1 flagellar basal body P-ring formation protein FlgA [Deltaproteobacteria bacterium]
MRKAVLITIFLTCLFGICLSVGATGVDDNRTRAIASRGYQTIPKATFREIFLEHLCRRLGKDKSDITVSRFKVSGNIPVPQGEIRFRVFQKDKRRLAGFVRLVALCSVNKVVKSQVKLSGWVDIFESVVCSGRNLKKGEIIERDDLYVARRNIANLSRDIVTDMSKALGLMAKHNIREDTCLKEWMLERSPILKRGDMVTIVAESDNLKVTVPGRVLEKGYLGELIKIQNVMSRKKIYARVVNSSTVIVDF